MLEEVAPTEMALTKRYVSKGAEEILYKKQPIERHPTGFVELVDYMGGDDPILRVATATRGLEAFAKRTNMKEVFAYLTTNRIMAPFNFAQLKLSIQAPISDALHFVYLSQANVNEYSGRYSEMLDSAHIPRIETVRETLISARGNPDNAEKIVEIIQGLRTETHSKYQEMLKIDFARELARSGLGANNDTRFYLKLPLGEVANVVRSGQGDLPTTRLYRDAIAKISAKFSPIAWEVLMASHHGRTDLVNPDYPKTIKLFPKTDEEIVDPQLSNPSWKPALTRRPVVPELEKLLFAPVKVLDYGEIQPTDYMGNTTSMAQAARTSYGAGTKTLQDDISLVRSLVRDRHNTPLEMAELALEMKSPVLVNPRQLGRHRTIDNHGFLGVNPVGSQSYLPPKEQMKYQDRKNRQGRGNSMEEEDQLKIEALLNKKFSKIADSVKTLRDLNCPEELIREQKGVSSYTIRSMTGDFHNWGHFISLRADPHAQWESRQYAEQIKLILQAHSPEGWKAVEDYKLNTLTFSAPELSAIQKLKIIQIPRDGLEERLTPDFFKGTPFSQLVSKKDPSKGLKLSREGEAFIRKLNRLFSVI